MLSSLSHAIEKLAHYAKAFFEVGYAYRIG
jgi:hypothetical protein